MAKKPAKKPLTREEARPLAALFEKKFGVTLPERLKVFFDSGEYIEHHGSYIWDLPYFSGDSKMKLKFGSKDLPDLFEYAADVFGAQPATHLPIARAGEESRFIAVDTTKPALPVSFFDYEEGFHPHADTFDEFLSRLLKKGEKTPVEKLDSTLEKSKKLWDDKKHAEAAALLEPALASFVSRRTPVLLDDGEESVGMALNLLGLCKKELGDVDAALELFTKAYAYGDKSAALNVMDHLLNDKQDFDAVIAYGEKVGEDIYRWFDEYAWYWVRLYLGYAYVVRGRELEAIRAYHEIFDSFASKDPSKLERPVKDLKEIHEKGLASGGLETRILGWIDVPPEPLAGEEIAKNRAWWATVPPKAKAKLLEAVKVEVADPDDAALARIVRLTELDFDHCELTSLSFLGGFQRVFELEMEDNKVTDLSPLARFTALRELDAGKNKVASLAPIAGLTQLTSLDVSENGLGSLAGLEGMANLEKLRANENEITSVEPLAGLPSLQDLTIYNNKLRDVSPLATCRRLKEISCFGNDQLRNGLAVLADLPWLEDIDEAEFSKADRKLFSTKKPGILDWRTGDDEEDRNPLRRAIPASEAAANRVWWDGLLNGASSQTAPSPRTAPAKLRKKVLDLVKDVAEKLDEDDDGKPPANPSDQALAGALREDSLHFDDCELTTLEAVAPFRLADWVNVSENPVSDLSPLAGFTRVRTLLVREMQLTSLAALAPLVHVEDLQCNENRLASLAGIEGMTGLRELAAQENPLTDIGALAGLVDLRELFLEYTQVDSLDALRDLSRLRRLWIQGTRVTDLSPLKHCTGLEELVCFSLPGLGGVAALLDLPFLRVVTTHGSLPAGDIATFREARPDVRID